MMKNAVEKDDDLQELARKMIYDVLAKRPFGHGSINDAYVKELHPWGDQPYPLNRVGTLTRVTRRFMPNWINIPRLCRKILRSGALEQISEVQNVFLYGDHRKLRDRLVLDVLCTIGTESYNDEWQAVESHTQLEEVIEASTNIPARANKLLADSLRRKLVQFFLQNPNEQYTILDIGPGTGNTSLALFETLRCLLEEGHLPSAYQRRVRLLLYDLQPRALTCTADRLKQYEPFISEIVKIQGNMGEISKCEEVQRYKGKVNVILAGASLIHNTDPCALFRALYDCLAGNGRIHIWDWHCGPSFAAPTLRFGTSGKRTLHLRSATGDNVLSISDYREELYDTNATLEEHIGSNTMDMIYEIDQNEAPMVIANFRTWIDLWGYHPQQIISSVSNREQSPGEQGLRANETIEGALLRHFWAGLESKVGFNCVRDFLEGIIVPSNIQPAGNRTAYYFIEGYGDDYAAVMRKVGFAEAIDVPFASVYYRGRTGQESLAHTKGSDGIRFTFGRKGN